MSSQNHLLSLLVQRSNPKHCLIAIVGPTAVGKSDLALKIAQDLGAEIISGDSRQVYRYMDIGTNKPTLAERALVPHHLIDIVDPDEDFSLAIYRQLATEAIKDVKQKGKLPLLVGGSGLYIWSFLEGWKMPPVPSDRHLRSRLEAGAEQEGSETLYQELQSIDPLAAAKIHPSNIRRIIRALEIYHIMGQPPSQLRRKEAPHFPILVIGLTMERSELYSRINCRVDRMVAGGLIEEVEGLLKKGYSLTLPAMSSIGYKQIGQFLQGSMTLPEAIEKIKHETHRLARHQYAWFRLDDKRIHWFDASGLLVILNEVKNSIASFVGSSLQKERAS
jgi:tRNA dimethylallyltransferase